MNSENRRKNANKLNILFVIDGYYPSLGGAEKQAQLLSNALYKAGHHIHVITPQLDKSKPINEVMDGIHIERIPFPRIKIIGALILLLRFAIKILKDGNNYDAIHVHMVKNLAAMIGLLKPFLKPKVIAKVSGAWEFDGGVLDEKLSSRPINIFKNKLIKRIDYLQAISKFTMARLQAAGYPGNKIKMIPNAIDTRKFKNSNHRNNLQQLHVVYTGRLRHVKGVDILIKAWAKVCDELKSDKPVLLIAGDGSQKEEIESLIDKLNLNDNVQLLGVVSDIPKILDQSNLYVQPSRQEGLSNSVLEAMSAGLPIIATRVSGNEDIIRDGENGILVEPENPGELANAIIQLLIDADMRKQMGKCSRKIVEHDYELDIVLQHLTTAYQGGL